MDQTSLRAKSPSLIGTAGDADPHVRWCGDPWLTNTPVTGTQIRQNCNLKGLHWPILLLRDAGNDLDFELTTRMEPR